MVMTTQIAEDQRHGDEIRAWHDQTGHFVCYTAAPQYGVQSLAAIGGQHGASCAYRPSPPPPQARCQQWQDCERRERAMSGAGESDENDRHANIDDLGAEPSCRAEARGAQPCQRHRANGIDGVHEHDPEDWWSVPKGIGWLDDDRQERTERESKASAGDEPVDALLPIIGARSVPEQL